MGYLSCKAHSSVEVSSSLDPSSSISKQQDPAKITHEKPLKIQQFEYSDLEAATNNFSEKKLLGRGSHGLVYKAVLRSGRLVAVKKPSRKQQPTASDEFDNEIHILSNLYSPRCRQFSAAGFTERFELFIRGQDLGVSKCILWVGLSYGSNNCKNFVMLQILWS